jgi:hypothetical protein
MIYDFSYIFRFAIRVCFKQLSKVNFVGYRVLFYVENPYFMCARGVCNMQMTFFSCSNDKNDRKKVERGLKEINMSGLREIFLES